MADTIRFEEVTKRLDGVKRTLESISREIGSSIKQELRDRSDEIVRMMLDDEMSRNIQDKLRKVLERDLGRMIDERIERTLKDKIREMYEQFKQTEEILMRAEKDIQQILKDQQK